MNNYHPKKGDEYWYVYVSNKCDFANVQIKSCIYNGELDYYVNSNNYFPTEALARDAANKVRAIFGQPPLS